MADKADKKGNIGFLARLNPFSKKKSYSLVPNTGGGWFPILREAFAGAWQMNITYQRDTILANNAVFSCMTLIASDISKLRVKMVRNDNGIWVEVPAKGYEVIESPNTYQNRIQFYENWINSKLARGNTYILKGRDREGAVVKLYILNPDAVTPLVADSGDVFYQLGHDDLTQAGTGGRVVPASELIHDRFNCLFHPLVGLSPIFACGLSAYNGLKIQENSAKYFLNMSRPSGFLTAPGSISDEVALRLKTDWEANFSGENFGKTAVLGDDLKYEALAMTAQESQMIEQLRMTAEMVCSTFHVPKYKVVGDAPAYNNIEALEQQYYSQCLQILIESIELCLDEGLGIPATHGCEFDLEGLLRMDTQTQITALAAAVGGGIMPPNHAMKKLGIKAIKGGDTVYMQQQYYSLEALSKRDALADPFGKTAPAATPAKDDLKDFFGEFIKGFEADFEINQ